MAELAKVIAQDRAEYVADMRAVAEELTPHGVTGDLAGSWEQYDDEETSTLYNMMMYAKFQEEGTEPFNMKLIEIDLGPRVQNEIRKRGHKVIKGKGGFVLVPILWDWGRLAKGHKRAADNYIFCWTVFHIIARKGIKAKHMLRRAVEVMRRRDRLYPLARSTGARIEVPA